MLTKIHQKHFFNIFFCLHLSQPICYILSAFIFHVYPRCDTALHFMVSFVVVFFFIFFIIQGVKFLHLAQSQDCRQQVDQIKLYHIYSEPKITNIVLPQSLLKVINERLPWDPEERQHLDLVSMTDLVRINLEVACNNLPLWFYFRS